MEAFLAGNLDEILVGADTGGFESLRAQLFILVGDEVDTEGEIVDGRTLPAEIEDTDLGVGDTTVEPRFGIRLHEELVTIFNQPLNPWPASLSPTWENHRSLRLKMLHSGVPCSCSIGSNGQVVEPF